MFRLLILIALIPIMAALFARWFYGIRPLRRRVAQRQCRCDLAKWENAFGSEHLPLSKQADAQVYAELLRKNALADWRTREPKAAASREATRRFGMAVPPLTAIILILAFIVAKIPISAAIAIFLLAIAFAILAAYLTIAPELKANLVTTRRLRSTNVFPRRDDEDAVISCANALVWKEAAPPILKSIQK